MKATSRDVNGVEIIKLEGKITIGSGDSQLREVIGNALNNGKNKILLDMHGVTTIDSSGIGELVGSYTTVTNRGGKLKLLHLPAKVSDPLNPQNLMKTSGRGIFYMKTFMDHIEYSFNNGGGTMLLMTKNLAKGSGIASSKA